MPSTIIRSQDIQMCIDNGSKFLRFVYVVVLMTWTEISDDDTLRFAIFPRTSLNLRLRHIYQTSITNLILILTMFDCDKFSVYVAQTEKAFFFYIHLQSSNKNKPSEKIGHKYATGKR